MVPDQTRKIASVANFPILVTLTQVGYHHVVDPTVAEEACMSGRFFVTVNQSGKSVAMHKGGQGGVSPASLIEMLKLGKTTALALFARLEALTAEPECAANF